jgi:hypothetical protein
LEEKISLLEQTNNDLRHTIEKNHEAFQNQVALVTKDNELLKVQLQQLNFASENTKKQMQAYQDVNGKLTTKLTDISKLYDSFGEILMKP